MQCVRHSRYRSDARRFVSRRELLVTHSWGPSPIVRHAPLCSPSRRAYALVMLLQPTYYTADMVRALPDDGNRYELVWGELLVSPSPRTPHQRGVGRIFVLLTAYCTEWGAAEAFISPADISWSDDTLVQPDVFVVPIEQATAGNWTSMQDLLLVAEVLSPSTARYDRFSKRRLYQDRRVPLVWLFDIDRAHVEVWTPGDVQPTIVRDQLTWHPKGASAPLLLDVAALFNGL